MIAHLVHEYAELGQHVLFMVHKRELLAQIRGSMAAEGIPPELVTVMSVLKVSHRLTKIQPPALLITDEAHHGKAKSYMNVYDYFSDVPRIGFTATPVRLNGEGFSDVYDAIIEGPTVEWLVHNHFLAPFKYYSLPLVDRGKLKKERGEYTNRSISMALAQTRTVFGSVVDTYRDKADGQQAILYAHNVEYSQRYAKMFSDAGIPAIHVDAKTPQAERDRIMSGFREHKYRVLCNVDLVSEGFDVPDCNTVILLRPTQSLTLFVQQSMRGMRYRSGKTSIIIDHVGNYLLHGLPDTNHVWNLAGMKEEDESKADTCKRCLAVVEQWEYQEFEEGKYRVCPYCGYRKLVKPVVPPEPRNDDMTENDDVELEEVDQNEFRMLELRNLAKRQHKLYAKRLLYIAQIFVARNRVAEHDGKKLPYHYPVFFAARQYAELNKNARMNDSRLKYDIKTLADTFGYEYHFDADGMTRYLAKLIHKQ